MIIIMNTETKKISFLGSFKLDEMSKQEKLFDQVGDYATVNVKDVLETEDKKLIDSLREYHSNH